MLLAKGDAISEWLGIELYTSHLQQENISAAGQAAQKKMVCTHLPRNEVIAEKSARTEAYTAMRKNRYIPSLLEWRQPPTARQQFR